MEYYRLSAQEVLEQKNTTKAGLTDEEAKIRLEKYGENADYILTVTPGLSGMWQISGRSDTGYEERINLDTYYIQNWSVWLDIWIIIKTVWVVINGKGAY